jgi:tungstate transport system substrate-binding protein
MVKNMRTSYLLVLLLAIVVAGVCFSGCASPTPGTTPTPTVTTAAPTTAVPTTTSPSPGQSGALLVSTTTSLEATGLLAAIQDYYLPRYGVTLRFVAQGTGQALDTARRCDADLTLVHSPPLEKTFEDQGYGINPRCFAYNYFIIVGPSSDPAKIKGLDPVVAFRTIAEAGMNDTPGVQFISRGDNSGTHNAEKGLWVKAGFNYSTDIQGASWYHEIGQGMGPTLTHTSEVQGYTLSDTGTFLAYKSQLNIVELVGQGPALLNRYSAIEVNPAKCPNVNTADSKRFINWLISDEGQQFIADYGVQEYGQSLFYSLNGTTCQEAQFNCTCTGNLT